VKHDIVPVEVLEALRAVGDPALPRPGDVFATTQAEGFLRVPGLRDVTTPDASIVAAINQVSPDADKVGLANRLFAEYGTEISGALLLAALPQAYATVWGSRVLTATAALQQDFRRRIVRTAQFLLIVMRQPMGKEEIRHLWPTDATTDRETSSSAPEDTRPWQACLAIRRFHESIRQQIRTSPELTEAVGTENKVPLNQEDLLGMLLSFTVTVFEVLEQFGITWSADEQEAYLHVWDLVGAHLGVGSARARRETKARLSEATRGRIPPRMLTENQQGWIGLRPVSISDTRLLLDQIRRRQWPPAALVPRDGGAADASLGGDTRSGRLLLRALLNELAASMPPRLRPLALSVIRRLAPPPVRERLNLGGGGIVLSMLDVLPQRKVRVDPFTVVPGTNPLTAKVTRMMANEVTMRAMVRFLRTESLFLPGLAEWSRDLIDPMEEGIA